MIMVKNLAEERQQKNCQKMLLNIGSYPMECYRDLVFNRFGGNSPLPGNFSVGEVFFTA
jgi:hypothetical protein